MTNTAPADAPAVTPFEMIGGHITIARMVDRFYDLMDHDVRYAELRAMHAPDLTPMRASLAGFLTGWLGGPRDWFEANPGKCVMSAHARLDIGPEAAEQWTDAMARALVDVGAPKKLAEELTATFTRMSQAMRKR